MTAGALLRKVPGRARPRIAVLAEIEAEIAQARVNLHKNVRARFGVDNPAVFEPFYLPQVERLYRFRVQLECGCVFEQLVDQLGEEERFPDSSRQRTVDGPLPWGEAMCRNHDEHAPPAPPYRQVVAWGVDRSGETSEKDDGRRGVDFPADPEQDPDGGDPQLWAKLRRAEPSSLTFWRVRLACGHVTEVPADVDWQPEHGPTLVSEERAAQMRARRDEYKKRAAPPATAREQAWRDHHDRMIDLRWPDPVPEHECYLCSWARRITGYQRIGWLVPREPEPPAITPRQLAQERVQRAQADMERAQRKLERARQALEAEEG